MNALNDQIVELTQAANIPHHDQLSALGMARNWIGNHKPVVRADPFHQLAKRDDLAEAIIAEIADVDADDALEALRHTRQIINAPYFDPRSNGQRGAIVAIPKPGD